MSRNGKIYIVIAAIVFCIVVFCLSTSVGQDRRRYEVETQVYGVPAYQSDAARAIEAYERLMERYLDLTERNLIGLAADVRVFTDKLDAIDGRLSTLDARLARIEQHLGIAPVISVDSPPDPNGLRRPIRPEVTRSIPPGMP
jgi:hypothetical protein